MGVGGIVKAEQTCHGSFYNKNFCIYELFWGFIGQPSLQGMGDVNLVYS